jgi:hypothetical protein
MIRILTRSLNLALVVALGFTTGLFAQGPKPDRLKWHDDYEVAKKEAEATGKPILLEFRCAP